MCQAEPFRTRQGECHAGTQRAFERVFCGIASGSRNRTECGRGHGRAQGSRAGQARPQGASGKTGSQTCAGKACSASPAETGSPPRAQAGAAPTRQAGTGTQTPVGKGPFFPEHDQRKKTIHGTAIWQAGVCYDFQTQFAQGAFRNRRIHGRCPVYGRCLR